MIEEIFAVNEPRILLNVGGVRFETYRSILKKIPATRLSRLTEALVNFDAKKNEYYFDRHPGVFSQILNYYRTGKLHYPTNVCGPLFEEELNFWGLDMNQVEPCCWKTYTKHRATEETLATLDRLNIDVDRTSRDDLEIKFGLQGMNFDRFTIIRQMKPIVWQLFEEPRSCLQAKIIACVHMSMIVLSVSILWVYTYSSIKYNTFVIFDETSSNTLQMIDYPIVSIVTYLDYITAAWFLFELIVRILVAPKKKEFIEKFDNYVDILATFWFFFELPLRAYFKYNTILNLFDSIRVFRLIRLLDYHPGLKIIITSIKQSANVLSLLLLVTVFSCIIYGSFAYYLERLTTANPDLNRYTSILDGFYYSVITLCTIGYGDYVPYTTAGRLCGVACLITGVFVTGLPMTIVNEIYANLYKHLIARSKLPKERRKIVHVEAPRKRKRKQTMIGHLKQMLAHEQSSVLD